MSIEQIIAKRWAITWEAKFSELSHDQLAEVAESLFGEMQSLIRECARLRRLSAVEERAA